MIWLCAAPAWAQETVGEVIDLEGSAWITHKGEKPARASLRHALFLEDVIETKADGGVKILFVDETILTVKENSRVLITQFLFDPKAKKRQITLETTLGRLRTIVTRFMGKDQGVEIKTPTAVAGIRGTDLGMMVEAKKSVLFCFHCEKQEVQAFNKKFPGEVVALSTGQAIAIIANRAARRDDITAIPKDILDKIDILFDIQKGSGAEAFKEAGKDEQRSLKEKAAAGVADKAAEVRENTGSTLQDGPEIIPGKGGGESTTGSTVTITIPQSK